jgi:toxin ParE1/3/4
MPELRYSAEAKEDLKQVARYIARDKPIAARQWATKLREKCRLIASHPGVGDDRPELGDGIRSSYLGKYVVFFQRTGSIVEIVRIIRGDRDTQSL